MRSGGNVTITCHTAGDEDLQWVASDGSEITIHTLGVGKVGQELSSTTLEVDLSVFHDRMVACGVKDQNNTLMRHNICGEYGMCASIAGT